MAIEKHLSENGILEVTMVNPPVNALNIKDTFEIATIFNDVARDKTIKVAILTASGKGFCAGVDIKEIESLSGHTGILDVNEACYDAFAAIYECAVPVLVAVNGFCLGTGIGLAGSADSVIAATEAQFGLPEVDNVALGALTHLQRLVPQQRARQMLYTCETASAAELASYGSVSQVVAGDELMNATHELAARIAEKPQRTIRAAKQSANGIELLDIRNSYRYEQGYTFELNLSGEGETARQAFLDGER